MGVLTHMDLFKSNKSLQASRKALKHRFWTEIYKGW
jgi:ribosome biogenesis protein BMS1